MKRTVLIILAFVVSACNTVTENSDMVQNDSIKVTLDYKFENEATLTGTLETLKYTNMAGEWFNTHILKLDSAITIASSNLEIAPVDSVTEVQIGFDEREIPKLNIYLNKRITLSGKLYNEQTVHDRRPVLMINAVVVE